MKLKPELLQHPNIPKPMHGLNPRTLKGQAWWDRTRHAVYEKQEFCCAACGVHKRDAMLSKWLECHEDYTIDYAKGRIEIKAFVGLCPACHKFIHSGRLAVTNEQSWHKKVMIVNHGWRILRANHLYPSAATMYLIDDAMQLPVPEDWMSQRDMMMEGFKESPDMFIEKIAPWSDWRMILEGCEYKPLHKSEAAWKAFYQ